MLRFEVSVDNVVVDVFGGYSCHLPYPSAQERTSIDARYAGQKHKATVLEFKNYI